ncbi:MAG: HD domain-containing protein [Bacilli bacterium]
MNLEENMYNHENNLSKFARLSKNAIRLKQEESDIRPAYFRDIDRIIYSLSYTRYIDKTQVFSLKENDHISKRIIHVQFVSKIAKTIGRALGLNEDLIEAIALGHDLGHVPFGHVGEKILNDISLKYDNTYFNHNAQSVRELMSLEKNGQGLNITIQVLDGILCHNGEFLSGKYIPKKKVYKPF